MAVGSGSDNGKRTRPQICCIAMSWTYSVPSVTAGGARQVILSAVGVPQNPPSSFERLQRRPMQQLAALSLSLRLALGADTGQREVNVE